MSIKINIRKFKMLLFWLIMLEPPLLYRYGSVHVIYKLAQFAVFVFVIMQYINTNTKVNKLCLLIIFFELWNGVVTWLNNPSYLPRFLYSVLYIIVIALGLQLFLKRDYYGTINSLYNVMLWYSVANFFTYIMYPYGVIVIDWNTLINNVWFLGIDNQFARFVLPAMVLMFVMSTKYQDRIHYLSYIVMSIMNTYVIIKTWSATSVVSYVMLVALSFIYLGFDKMINKKILINGYIILYFVCIVLQNLNISFINRLIINVLGKDLTFSGRLDIWMEAIRMIAKSPFIGYGSVEGRTSIVYPSGQSFSSHNIILQILLESGLVGLVLFILFFLVVYNCKKNTKIENLGWIGVFGIMVSMLMEVYQLEFLCIMLFLIYECPVAGLQIETKKENYLNENGIC